MQDFLFFLGRFHVLALHLPIGLVIAAVVLDWLARRPSHAALARASAFLWGGAALSAVLAAALGYLHFAEGGVTGPAAEAHRFWGSATAVVAALCWWLAARRPGAAGAPRLAAGMAAVAVVAITGHYGGNLTHGSGYLAEYAPGWLRSLTGGEPRRPRVTSIAAADPYLDIVQPLLERRCATCHNDDKLDGGFSVGSYDSTLAGGDTGRAVVPGNVEASELLYRVSLPPEDQAFMPAEGKTPLTAEQVAILRWWVGAGAPRATTAGAVGVPAEVEPLLAAELGIGAAPSSAAATAIEAKADPRLVADLAAAGLLARQVSQSDARLVVSSSSPGTPLDAAALGALATARGLIVDLNLTGTALDDAGLAAIGALPAATHLRLARNALTDAGLAALAQSPNLEHLNLYGNAGVTDAGVETLATFSALREVYLWQTAVTAAGAARLRALRPEMLVQMGAAEAGAAASSP